MHRNEQRDNETRYLIPTALFFELGLGYSKRDAKRAERDYLRRAKAAGMVLVKHKKRGSQ